MAQRCVIGSPLSPSSRAIPRKREPSRKCLMSTPRVAWGAPRTSCNCLLSSRRGLRQAQMGCRIPSRSKTGREIPSSRRVRRREKRLESICRRLLEGCGRGGGVSFLACMQPGFSQGSFIGSPTSAAWWIFPRGKKIFGLPRPKPPSAVRRARRAFTGNLWGVHGAGFPGRPRWGGGRRRADRGGEGYRFRTLRGARRSWPAP